MCKIISVILKNQAIQHNKLNSVERPCQTSHDYNFAHCVHKHIIQSAGCQPHWRLVSLEGIPECQNLSMLQKYSNFFWNLSYNMDADDVFRATNCLRPCTYIEYKVNCTHSYNLPGQFPNSLQLAEDPLITPLSNENITILRPAFINDKIEVLKEVPAYPALSLVADVGGVLGLFIGFNFLMLWDWIVWGVEKIYINT